MRQPSPSRRLRFAVVALAAAVLAALGAVAGGAGCGLQPASAPTVAESAVAPDSDVAERFMIDRAMAELTAGRTDDALGVLKWHLERFPGGRHAQERELLWIVVALVRAGRTSEARERFARFERTYPDHPRLGEFRSALSSAPNAP